MAKLDKLEKKLIAQGVPPEKAKALLELGSDETVAAVLESLAQRDDDYAAQLGRVQSLTTKNAQLEQVKKDYDDWYQNQALPAMQRLSSGQVQPQQYQSQPQQVQPTVPALTAADLEAAIKAQASNFARVIKEVGEVTSYHAATYKEKLDMNALEAIAMEKNLSIPQAYEAYESPRKQAQYKAEREAAIKAAREEAVKEYVQQHGLPASPVPTELNYVNRHNIPSDMKEDDAAISQELLKTWNSVPARA